MRLSSARGLQDAAPLFDETGRAVRRPGPQETFPPTVRSPASRRQAASQRAMASRRANDGFPSSGHLQIEFFLFQAFRAVAGQVDGKAGFPDSGGQRAGPASSMEFCRIFPRCRSS